MSDTESQSAEPQPDPAAGVPPGFDDNTVYPAPTAEQIPWEPPPPPDHPDAPPVQTEYGDGEKTAPIGGWPVEPTRPEPAFPESIRFESGHPEDLKAWLSDWIEWKFGR